MAKDVVKADPLGDAVAALKSRYEASVEGIQSADAKAALLDDFLSQVGAVEALKVAAKAAILG